MKISVIELDNGVILKGEYVRWNEYGIVMKNIKELDYEEGENGEMEECEHPSIYPKDIEVCFDRGFIISEYNMEV